MAKVVLALLVVAAAVFYILFKAPQGGQVNASVPAPAMVQAPPPVALPAASGAAASAPSATSATVAEAPASAAQP
ncbi:hypothetical protein LBW59_02935 [Ralstonia solanacearum]|uniref:Uncharacterized protein n=1 Tax=Ralstonia solanacearum TaxID=305 RepID=A0AAW5ZJZ0_RALSL|nr:hypothetical protein [Ralstonia solanacearum]MBB6590936.1 hypothetical protein [Ralstonia solanacearum]MBB6595133.1 hypothetical protein [Ralstonia solanacearum]MDB0542837.1 hypothetical protein [Ralstonia solanacearum]MDB0553121.1 hypothetical protein [Ralstonia solanacearum]MDB0557843.1 hypothetical protein [Ralstonia solanacearum]